jgi:hypothetical protein
MTVACIECSKRLSTALLPAPTPQPSRYAHSRADQIRDHHKGRQGSRRDKYRSCRHLQRVNAPPVGVGRALAFVRDKPFPAAIVRDLTVVHR